MNSKGKKPTTLSNYRRVNPDEYAEELFQLWYEHKSDEVLDAIDNIRNRKLSNAVVACLVRKFVVYEKHISGIDVLTEKLMDRC